MATKTMNATQDVPNGFLTRSGSKLPPFFSLDIGQEYQGMLSSVRVTQEERGKGKAKRVETRYRFEFQTTKTSQGNDGSKAHKAMTAKEGDIVTLSVGGQVDKTLLRDCLEVMGVNIKTTDEDNWPEPKWDKLYGYEYFVRRIEDGVMKKGPFAGKRTNQYVVAHRPPKG